MTDSALQTEIDSNYKHNLLVNVFDGTFFWFGASFMAARTILPLFISYLTDSTLAIGILSTIVSTGWLLPQLFTSNWVQKLPVKKVGPVKWGFFTERLPVFLLAPAAWLSLYSPTAALVVFLVLVAWHVVGAGVVAVAWQDMLAKIFSTERRGRFFGTANFLGNGTGILGASAAAWVLVEFDFPYNFMICFGAAGLFILISWFFLAMTREPAQPVSSVNVSNKNYFKSLPKIIKENKNYRRYLISQVVTAFGTMSLGFYTIYAIRQFHATDAQVSLFTTSLLIGQALSNLVFGWLADKKGHKLVLEIATLASALAIGTAFLAPSEEFFFAVFALQGISNAGFIISGIMIVFEFCTPEVRPTYIGLSNSIIGIFSGVSPLVGGFLANDLGFPWLFGISLGIMLTGLALLHFYVYEPRHESIRMTTPPRQFE